MKKYSTLLFDADGTLLDFARSEAQALQQTLRKYGVHPTPEIKALYEEINHALWADFEQGYIDKDTVVETRFRLLFGELGLDIDGTTFEADYQPALAHSGYLIDGAFDVCKSLSQNLRLYIVTNGVSSTQYSRLSLTHLDTLVQGIFVSEDAGAQKPTKAFFNYVFAKIPHFNRSRTLIIGDSLASDIKGGIQAGIDTCWYNPKGLDNTTDIFPDYEITRLGELYEILNL